MVDRSQPAQGDPELLTARVEIWDGHVWKIVPSAVGGLGNELDSVSCVSSISCQAVGGTATSRTLVESWDGHVWRILSSPNPSQRFNWFFGVSCASTISCKAVGSDNFTFSYG